MNNTTKSLEKLGFGEWLQGTVAPESLERFALARVVAVHKESYTISNGEVDVFAELVGKMLFSASSPTDYPSTGDWVLVNFYDENTFAVIHEVLPRKSLLKRKTPGKKVDFQLIAANIDVALIVQSLNEDFNLRRLERYLVMVNDANIQPIVLLSKSDLLISEEITERIAEIHAIMPSLSVLPFSNDTESGLEGLRAIMKAGWTYCLLGSSGVGKTTLINKLLGEAKFKTKEVSRKESRGRHSTTHRQLILLDSGAMMVDTPGMRELGNFSVDSGMDETFSEIKFLSEQCRFNNCTHTNEKGCAVLDAVEKGQLSAERYRNYIKMNKESAYNEMSYLEKRKKEQQFGKFCKTVMKQQKNQK
ncbi:MAG: ribosome small subunit-dependent GTPase A [Deltaproteobacteria bacterium]|nr:ribosome small subunit-dependent GTPase A [Deltaproteobacteria bacterium]